MDDGAGGAAGRHAAHGTLEKTHTGLPATDAEPPETCHHHARQRQGRCSTEQLISGSAVYRSRQSSLHSCGYDKNTLTKQFKSERVYFSSQFQVTILYCGPVTVTGA